MPNHSDKIYTDDLGIHVYTTQGGGAVGTEALEVDLNAGKGAAAVKGESNQKLKETFYQFLHDKYMNVDCKSAEVCAWERMGAALIAHQMTGMPRVVDNGGAPWGDSYREVDEGVWKDLKARLEVETLIMEQGFYSNATNTVGVLNRGASLNVKYDAVDYAIYAPTEVHSWIFRYEGSAEAAYALEIECANPLGRLRGLDPAPPKDYSLTPSVSTDGKSSVEPGGEIVITGTVNNPSDNPSNETEWRLTRIVYGAGPNPTSTRGTTNASGVDTPDTRDPCSFFDPAGRIPPPCEAIESGTGRVFDPKVVATVVNELKYDVPNDVEIGTEICFALSVKPPTHEAAHRDRWRHSDLSCVMVSKSPKVQIWGGDVRVGGSIDVSSRDYTTPSPVTYGSWGEYGVLSGEVDTVPPVGVNSGFASGSGLSGGNADSSQSSWSALTFANTGTVALCDFGCYNFTISSSALVEQFVVATTMTLSGNVNLDTLGSGTYRATGPVTLTPTTVGSGKSIIILSDHEIAIEGDITYSNGPYTNLRDIPQVVLRAPTINIKNGAGVVDAWLFAVATGRSGVLNTCSDVAISANLSSNMCNNPLRVNGPVVADKVYLRRTAGSDGNSGDRGDPAEVFNLRADAYLWANGYSSGKSQARTVYVKELPPRF